MPEPVEKTSLGLCNTCAEWQPDYQPAVAYYWTPRGVMCLKHFLVYEESIPDPTTP